jgi:hypothetical protein
MDSHFYKINASQATSHGIFLAATYWRGKRIFVKVALVRFVIPSMQTAGLSEEYP